MYGHALRLWRAFLILFRIVLNAASNGTTISSHSYYIRNHNERKRESCTIRHPHHRSILYQVRRWNLSCLLFPAFRQYGHVLWCIRASLCNTCAIFYYLDSTCSDTLNFDRAENLLGLLLFSISRNVTT